MAVKYGVMESVRVPVLVQNFLAKKSADFGISRATLVRDLLVDGMKDLEKGKIPARLKKRLDLDALTDFDENQETAAQA